MLVRNLLVCTEEKSLERLPEVFIERDVDHWVDHCVAVGKHVDPEGVSCQLVVGQIS
jgi:hypothetical protein